MMKKILVIGTFDSKQAEYEYLVNEIEKLGGTCLGLDVGTFAADTSFLAESISNQETMEAAGANLDSIRADNDRGQAMKLMSQGASALTKQLFQDGQIGAVIGMGGSGGSSVISAAMQALPIGVPKVLLSTMAGGNTASYVGYKDIVLIPAVTDIAGLNQISRIMIASAAAAVCGMARAARDFSVGSRGPLKTIAASMFGNTTQCIQRCVELLEDDSTEVIVFHATGTGGRTMESLILDQFFDAVLDITTTEIADEICGGILSAGPDRLTAAGKMGIAQLVVPGCVDMVNFGPLASVPKKYQNVGRNLYEWNPSITLMRTNIKENIEIGKQIAEKLNSATGPVQVLLPLRGVSILDGDGELFCDRKADEALFETLKSNLSRKIPVHEVDCNINDDQFAQTAVDLLSEMLEDDPPTP